MGTLYNTNANVDGALGWGLPFSEVNFSASLTAVTNTVIVVPGGGVTGLPGTGGANTYIAVFEFEAVDTWVAVNQVAEIPAGAAFALTGSVLTPGARYVKAGDELNFFSTLGGDVSISIYKLQE